MKSFLHLIALTVLLTNLPAWADSVLMNSKKHGTIEFTSDAHELYKKYFSVRQGLRYLLDKHKCEAQKSDLQSNAAVYYSYACVVELKKKSIIVYSANVKSKTSVNYYVGLLDDNTLNLIRSKTDFQLLMKQKPKPVFISPKSIAPPPEPLRFWYKLTLIDIQDPENLQIAEVKLSEFDQALNEIEMTTSAN